MSRNKFNLDKIASVLSDNDENWHPRMKALVDLEKYVTNHPQDAKVLNKEFFRQLRIPMQKQLLDLRSSIVREACKTITSIAVNGSANGNIVIDFCLPNIIEVSAGANKVMATYASKCLWSTLKICEEGSKQVIHKLVDAACHSKNTRIRENAMEGICIVVEHWETLSERDGEEIFTALRSGYEDASSKTRAKAREAFWPYDQHFHESANALLGIMDTRQKRTIMNIKPPPSNNDIKNGKNLLKINTALNKTMRIKPLSGNNSSKNFTKNDSTMKKVKKHVIKIQSPRVISEGADDSINVAVDTNDNESSDNNIAEDDEENTYRQRYSNNVTMDDTMNFDDLVNETHADVDEVAKKEATAIARDIPSTNNDNVNDDATLPIENVAELLAQTTTIIDDDLHNNNNEKSSINDVDNGSDDKEITFNNTKEAWSDVNNNNAKEIQQNESNLQPLSRQENNENAAKIETIAGTSNKSGLIIKGETPVPTSNSLDPNMSTTEIGLHLLQNHREHVDQILAILRREMEILGQFEQKETIKATDVALYASNIADAMHEREILLENMYNLLGETCSSLK